MAEVVGTVASALTIAALFKLFVDAFDVIRTAQKQTVDLKKLTLKLNIEKCRLYTWGQTMGLTGTAQHGIQRPLDLCPYPETVCETLELILDLFKDSDKLKNRYGCEKVELDDPRRPEITWTQGSVMHQLNASFYNFKIKSATHVTETTLVRTANWIIHDRKKFQTLIQEIKGLIDGLQDITKDLGSLAIQEEMIRQRIFKINDIRTLDWVAEICENDHPSISDAASLRAGSCSEATTFHRGIRHWNNNVEDYNDFDGWKTSELQTAIDVMEQMTLTEIKQMTFQLIKEMEEAQKTEDPSRRPKPSLAHETYPYRPDIDPSALEPSKLVFCRVLYDYKPDVQYAEFDLEVRKGDLVAVLSNKDPVGNESEW